MAGVYLGAYMVCHRYSFPRSYSLPFFSPSLGNKRALDWPHRTGNVLTSSVYANIQVTMGTFGNYKLGS